MTDKGNFIMGVDLGQANDYTAVSILEQKRVETDGKIFYHYEVRHLERLRGITYPQQVAHIKKMYQSLKEKGSVNLVVDQTGVGRPVVDMLRDAGLYCIAVTITGGDSVTGERPEYRVPKRDLVTAVQVLLQSERLRISSSLKEAQTLVNELLAFRVSINLKTGHDSYGNDAGAWRENPHDDLVLATAIASWYAERNPYTPYESYIVSRRHAIGGVRDN
jgi:Terminase RNaseH-like domain